LRRELCRQKRSICVHWTYLAHRTHERMNAHSRHDLSSARATTFHKFEAIATRRCANWNEDSSRHHHLTFQKAPIVSWTALFGQFITGRYVGFLKQSNSVSCPVQLYPAVALTVMRELIYLSGYFHAVNIIKGIHRSNPKLVSESVEVTQGSWASNSVIHVALIKWCTTGYRTSIPPPTILLRKSGSDGNEPWPLDHRGGQVNQWLH
jgi:hypothetical protein